MAGRVLAHDDVGDPDGRPVVYLHGTPDSRLARHPDDAVAAQCGVRLLAVDRPGFGSSALEAGPLGPALDALADELGLEQFALVGWSSGGLAALAAAASASLADRVRTVVLAATLPPVEAYGDPAVLGALGPGRRVLAELAAEVPPAELAAEVAGQLVPQPLTAELALAHVVEGAGAVGRAELEAVPGAAEAIAAGLRAGVAHGLAGVEQDLVDQLTPGLDLAAVRVPVHTVHGAVDDVSPPAVGEWLVARLPEARLEVVPDAAHHLLFPHWAHLLELASR